MVNWLTSVTVRAANILLIITETFFDRMSDRPEKLLEVKHDLLNALLCPSDMGNSST